MFERLTDRGRRVLILAQEEARLLGHDHIGTEQLLLGLIEEQDGIAARALGELGVTLDGARRRIEEIIGRTIGQSIGSAPFTPRMKVVFELSLREALQLGHSYIGTEHLLLGLEREGEGVGARVLKDLGVELPRVRQTVMQVLSGYEDSGMEEAAIATFEVSNFPRCAGCSADLEQVLRYRLIKIPPTSPDPFPLSVEVVYCSRCGQVISVLRAEPTD